MPDDYVVAAFNPELRKPGKRVTLGDCRRARAAVAKAKLPKVDLYVDDDGEEWRADQLRFVNAEEHEDV